MVVVATLLSASFAFKLVRQSNWCWAWIVGFFIRLPLFRRVSCWLVCASDSLWSCSFVFRCFSLDFQSSSQRWFDICSRSLGGPTLGFWVRSMFWQVSCILTVVTVLRIQMETFLYGVWFSLWGVFGGVVRAFLDASGFCICEILPTCSLVWSLYPLFRGVVSQLTIYFNIFSLSKTKCKGQ